jgi:hypothetical protein
VGLESIILTRHLSRLQASIEALRPFVLTTYTNISDHPACTCPR